MRKLAAGVALAALAAVPQARAQRVRGMVTDSITRERIAAAVVTFTDSAGTLVARTIADTAGHFSLPYFPAARTMRVVRIGYRPRQFALAKSDSVVDVRMEPIAAVLGAIHASNSRLCPGRAGTGDAFDLWEQARAGLLASVVSREVRPPQIRLRTFRRTLDPVLRRSLADTIQFENLNVNRSFVAARPAWVFAENGYMRESPGGLREYYAPDEGVLLDRTFAATHCLHVVDGEGPHAAQVGLAFEPVHDDERDTLVDVTGTLWIDRATFRLQTLEYHYTNLEGEARDAGGEITFAVMPNGVSMIARWVIHSPMLAHDLILSPSGVPRDVPRPRRRNVRILGYRETGGQIAVADFADGSHWQSDLPHLSGVVVDRDGKPVAGAVVWAARSADSTRTNAEGRFDLPPAIPGVYVLLASDSTLAAAGVSRTPPVTGVVFIDGSIPQRLELYPREDVFRSICPQRSYRPGTAVVLARVIDSRGAPASGAEVQIETGPPRERTDTLADAAIRFGIAGDDGRFIICGIDHERRLVLRAFKGRDGGGVAIDRWGDEFLATTIRLKPVGPP